MSELPKLRQMNLVAFITDQILFSARTFGPGERTKGVIQHIRKELEEIEAKPDDLSEYIDVVILALDGAWRQGYSPEEIAGALVAKLEKNKARKWPDWRTMSEGQAIEHIRDEMSPLHDHRTGSVAADLILIDAANLSKDA
jgi:hypothetical protein